MSRLRGMVLFQRIKTNMFKMFGMAVFKLKKFEFWINRHKVNELQILLINMSCDVI